MNILVFNIGSATIKYSVYSGSKALLKGLIDEVKSYSAGLKRIKHEIKKGGVKIDAVGHRVVHGGRMKMPQKITKKTLKLIKDNEKLAPLHNPHNMKGILVAMELFNVPQVAVFDTAFHSSIPEVASTYAIPKKLREKHGIRRYGFHGISHEYIYQEACRLLHKRKTLKAITCHLGNGCSIAAIDKGRSVDTSMGFTPLEGVVMGTRSGSIDPAIVDFLIRNERLSSSEVTDILNRESGLLALSTKTNNMREILNLRGKDKNSRLAIDIFSYTILKYIGSYTAVLDGADAIVFTAGIGENAWFVRKKISDNLKHLGVKLDHKKNKRNELVISAPSSKVKVMVIPTREDLMIARQTEKLLNSRKET